MDIILKWALKNALDHKGKASVNAVIPKILGEKPELREDMKRLVKEIKKIVDKVNKMDIEEQKNKLKKMAPELLEKKKKTLKELPNAIKRKFVARLPPEPSKYLHLGHAIGFYINYLYVKKYDGKLILRFEDTNPIKVKKEYYDSIRNDLKEIGIKWDKEIIISSRMDMYYDYCEKLLKKGHAYVCTCRQEDIKKDRWNKKECKCRARSINENMELWKKMHKDFKEGEAIVRLKGDIKSNDSAMRDPTIFRIITHKHPLQGKKYRVWPNYDFTVSIEDGLEVTHVMRSAEFINRTNLQNYIRKLLGLKNPTMVHYSRINIIGLITKGREIRKMIESGEAEGWDDPRLATIKALLRRGIKPETIERLAKDIGTTLSPTNIGWDKISAINREIIDKEAERHFFVKNPVRINVLKAPENLIAEVPLHPERDEKRRFEFGKKLIIFIEKEDFAMLKKEKKIRLKDLANIEFKNNSVYYSKDQESVYNIPKIHWLPEKGNLNVEVLMPDGKWINGIAERYCEGLKLGQIIQFERFGFCRVDNKTPLKFVYGHR